jgi:hypothetical protein
MPTPAATPVVNGSHWVWMIGLCMSEAAHDIITNKQYVHSCERAVLVSENQKQNLL